MFSPGTDQIILVDENNRALGSAEKHAAHRSGLLHRAFSVFLCDAGGRVLLQQRHASKYHSGGLWANSCCGHPRTGERTKTAARRRVHEELGVGVDLTFGFRARYHTSFANGLHENEIVYVYFGRLDDAPQPDRSEISDVTFVSLDDIAHDVRRRADAYAYWFRYYFESHFDEVARGVAQAAGTPPRASTKRAGAHGR
jgi:isopentenyl-diphosphate delta-isomerase